MRSRYGNFVLGPESLFYDGQDLPASYGAGAKGYLAGLITTRNAPRWQINTSTDYDISIGSYGVLTPGVDLTYVTQYRTRYAPLPFAVQNAYFRTDARVNWTLPESNWSASLFMTNVQNKAIRIFTTPNQGGIIYDQYMDPRIYGLRLSYRM